MIGFPAPLLGNLNLRLQVYYFEPGLLLIEKPAGVTSEVHPWYPNTPVLVEGLRRQVQLEKPELDKYHIEQLRSVYFLESEVSGAALFATTRDAAVRIRNLFGSNLIRFQFLLLVEHRVALDDFIVCDLPLAPHVTFTRSVVSHKSGKKSETHFRLRERFERYSVWEAHTYYLRPHQIRIHAHEVGLAVLGEHIYREVGVPSLNQLKGVGRGFELEKPLYESVCIHLECLNWNNDKNDTISIRIPEPKRLTVLLKHLRRYS